MTAYQSSDAPEAIGPYSQAIGAEGLLFVSGQLPADPVGGDLVEGSIETQTRRCLENIIAILAEAGLTLANVVKTTVYLRDMADFAAMNTVYGAFFKQPYPARAAVAVAGLPKGARIEIEAIACRSRQNA